MQKFSPKKVDRVMAMIFLPWLLKDNSRVMGGWHGML